MNIFFINVFAVDHMCLRRKTSSSLLTIDPEDANDNDGLCIVHEPSRDIHMELHVLAEQGS